MKTEREELKDKIERFRITGKPQSRRYSSAFKKEIVDFVNKCVDANMPKYKAAKCIGMNTQQIRDWENQLKGTHKPRIQKNTIKEASFLSKAEIKQNQKKKFMLKMDDVTITSSSKKAIMNHISSMVMAHIEEI